MPSKKPPIQERDIATLLFRALEEQNRAWVHRALEASPTVEAARALDHFSAWHGGLFLSIIRPAEGLRVFRELPLRAQAAILREMKPAHAYRLLAAADKQEKEFFLSLLDELSTGQISCAGDGLSLWNNRCGVPR